MKITNRIQSFFAVMVIAVLLNACGKGSGGGTKPDPPPEPPKNDTIILPKKQMRGVWIATVYELDWPQGVHDPTSQKKQYTDYLDKFQQLNINAVFVQIKGMGDAFYNSPYEPWSASITGTRGQNPGYDVLKFMIDETHARNIEFHAWINPFRMATRASSATPYPPLHASVNPAWVVSHEKWQMYNPAIPEARQRLADIVKDIITKYNVDGIHMDDYFYPDPASAGVMVSDQSDYATYGTGYATIESFRRANVDKVIQGVHDVIIANKPDVVFSISPTQNADYNLNTLYADIDKWARDGLMDIVIPQLYTQSVFESRLNTWDKYNNQPPLMIGHGYYQMANSSELSTQLILTKSKKNVLGTLFYSAKYFYDKPDLTITLSGIFKDPAVIPFLGRAVAAAPPDPQNVKIEGDKLKWTISSGMRSVVYYTSDLKQEGKVLAITTANEWTATAAGYYAVSVLNADNKESKVSNPVKK